MDEKPKKVIIMQVKKGHGEGHHGGSWKVAYADFVTAMMAFFLLMWLLNMTSQEKRAVMALYFRHFSLFQHGGQSFMMDGGMKPSAMSMGGQQVVEGGDQGGGSSKEEQQTSMKVMTGVAQNTGSLKEQVFMGITDEGIRIQIVDSPENPIFPTGSAQLTDTAKKAIRSIAVILKQFPNEIAIEGHTDGSPIRNEQISNWELSTARASAARREIEQVGIDPERIARVVGYADKFPLIPDNVADPRNRRISIVFLKSKKQTPTESYQWMWRDPTKHSQ